MEPIFNFHAQIVGWLEDEIAFSDDGWPVAFIHEGAVFAAKNGHYIGHFHDGVFRDCLGCIVAFLQGNAVVHLTHEIACHTDTAEYPVPRGAGPRPSARRSAAPR